MTRDPREVGGAWTTFQQHAFDAPAADLAPFVARSPTRLAALVVAGLAVKALTFAAFGFADPWTYRFFPSEIATFAIGALSFHALRMLRHRPWFERASPWVAAAVIGAIVFYPFRPNQAPLADAAFLVLFAAEWGDLSQLFTITLVARYDDPVGVFVGALGALMTVSAIAVIAGRGLLRYVSLHVLHYIGAAVCLVLGLVTLYELVS